MNSKNFIWKKIFQLCLAVSVYFYSCYIGDRGIYLFDFSITYNMGWLIFNGWVPFTDFKMPLMPLSGILTALGFWLFGVKYYSAVKLAGIICAIGVLLIGKKLEKYLGSFFGYIAAAMIVLATVPITGTLYYNHLSMLLFSVYLVLVMDFILEYKVFSGRRETFSSAMIYLFIALMVFNKLHIGVMAGMLFLGLEGSFFLREKNRLKDVVQHVAIRLMAPFIFAAALLIWVNFNVLDLIDSVLHSAKTSSYVNNNSLMKRIGIGDEGVFSVAVIGVHLIIFFAIGLIFYHLKFCKKNVLMNALVCFLAVAPVVQVISFISSAEAPSIDVVFIMVYLVMVYVYFTKTLDVKNNVEARRVQFICAIFVSSLFLPCAMFTMHYSSKYLRKSYDENTAIFSSQYRVPRNKHNAENYFFSKVSITDAQKKNFNYLDQVLKDSKTEKVFFGPELEMFYPATAKFPPKRWPVWMHADVSYNSDNHLQMREIFMNQKYDIIFLSKNRYGFTSFVNDYILSEYVELKQVDPEVWIRVFIKKK